MSATRLGPADGPIPEGPVLGDRYQLVSRIGAGASAEVFYAYDRRLNRQVAIKRLRSGFVDDTRFLKLFRSEAHLAAQLSHPNIVTVYDWSDGTEEIGGGFDGHGAPFIVTELLTGGSLLDLFRQPVPLSPSQVAFIGLQAAQGLAFAHEQGLVHRDVKPANLLFGPDGRVRIADFGIARAVAQAAWTEPEGVLIGTARYAAPEQAQEGVVDGAADVYSLTLCLIEALTGQVPLVRETALGTMVARQTEDVEVTGAWGPLAAPLVGGGRADPARRSTAAELLDGLLLTVRDLPDPEPLPLVDITAGADVVTGSVNGDRASDQPTDMPLPSAAGPDDGSLRRRRLLAAGVFAVLAAGALYGGLAVGNAQPDTTIIELAWPRFEVPDYRSMTVDEITVAADEQARWSVEVNQRYEDDTEPGQVLAQSPEPGRRLPAGETITVDVSLGSELRVVPELVGLDRQAAADAIASARLAVGEVIERNDEDAPVGAILEATVDGIAARPGSEFVTGTAVDLIVSSGPEARTVPSLVGLTVEVARGEVAGEQLELAVEEAYSETVPEGEIVSSDPEAGAQVARDSTVNVVVSLGLPFVTVPDVAGKPASEAADLLEAAGFVVTDTEGAPNRPVLVTDPPAGESRRKGSTIRIIVQSN